MPPAFPPGSNTNQKAAPPAHPAGTPPHPARTGPPGVVPGPAAVVLAETDQRPACPIGSLQPARGPGFTLHHPGQAAIFSVLDRFYFPEGESGSSLCIDTAELAESTSNTGEVPLVMRFMRVV